MTNPFSLLLKLIRLNSEYFYLLKKSRVAQQDGWERKEKRRKRRKYHREIILVMVTLRFLIMHHNLSKYHILRNFLCFPCNSDCGIIII